MKSCVLARTAPLPKGGRASSCKDGFLALSGRAASVSHEESFASDVREIPEQAAEELGRKVLGYGHTSTAEHYSITLEFREVSKLMAMVLNSFQICAVTERSGRYGKMFGRTTEERMIYDKWLHIFEELIVKDSPHITQSAMNERARENARYTLSVFTSDTSIVYTTNMRQWNAVYAMLSEYKNRIINDSALRERYTPFMNELSVVLTVLESYIKSDYIPIDADFCQNMWVDFTDNHEQALDADEQAEALENGSIYAENYVRYYKASYAMLAHLHRHRAIKYYIMNGSTGEYYVPKLLRGTEYEEEWIRDLSQVEFPQAELVLVKECGHVNDYLRKCDLRLCGRVLLETMENTKDGLMRFADESVLSGLPKNLANKIRSRIDSDGRVLKRCEVVGTCKQPCHKLGVAGTELERFI